MVLLQLQKLRSDHNRLVFFNKLKLALLALGLVAIWFFAAGSELTDKEKMLWDKVRAAQLHISQFRQRSGVMSEASVDPWQTGMIGLEWSGITTTMGDLAAKRTASDPFWSVQFTRWFRELGLEKRDTVVIFSSGSFPGMLLNALAAAESMDMKTVLIASLGASTWGANHPGFTLPVLLTELRSGGFINTQAGYYTLGGGSEIGNGMAPEGKALLEKVVQTSGVKLLSTDTLEEMISMKTDFLLRQEADVFINIGGSQANLGSDEDAIYLPSGLVSKFSIEESGNGVIGAAMRGSIPVIHMLNLKSLCKRIGLQFDSPPRKKAPAKMGALWSVVGLFAFFGVLLRHHRWLLSSDGSNESL
ncbi:poly-gamma-glutamate system protein [bacterium]|nr:poly-gamma-glutamate system protein [bacterium]